MKDKAEVVTIPSSAITEISYGQDVHRRVGAAIGLAVVSFGIGGLSCSAWLVGSSPVGTPEINPGGKSGVKHFKEKPSSLPKAALTGVLGHPPAQSPRDGIPVDHP